MRTAIDGALHREGGRGYHGSEQRPHFRLAIPDISRGPSDPRACSGHGRAGLPKRQVAGRCDDRGMRTSVDSRSTCRLRTRRVSLTLCAPPERCPSGRRSTPGKCVYVNSVPRVRIPPSPPCIPPNSLNQWKFSESGKARPHNPPHLSDALPRTRAHCCGLPPRATIRFHSGSPAND